MFITIYIFHFWLLHTSFKCFFIPKKFRFSFCPAPIWTSFFVVQLFIATNIIHPFTMFFANCFMTFLLGFSLFQVNYKKLVFLSMASCCIGMLIEIIVALVLHFVQYSSSDSALLGTIMSKLILLSLVHGISIFQNHRSHNSPSIFSWVLLLIMTFSSFIIIHTLYYFSRINTSPQYTILSITSIFLLIFVNIGFFVFDDKLCKATDTKIENLIMSQQIKRYEELRSSKEEQLHFFNREKHNLKNQLLSIRAYAQKEDNTAIINFINKLLNEDDFGLSQVSVCSNLVLDALIGSKLTIARKTDIYYTWDIDVPSQLPVNDIDLCILVGNAIENAFDACLASENNDKFINVTIHYKQNCLYFHFKNSYSHHLHKVNNALLSTKADPSLHGYGLPSIQSIVDKYNGTFVTENENRIFSLKIMLYIN